MQAKKTIKTHCPRKKNEDDDDDDEVVTRNDSDFFGDHADRLKIKEKKSQLNTVWKKTIKPSYDEFCMANDI